MKNYSQQTIRHALVGTGNLRNLLSDRFINIDPYSDQCFKEIKKIFDQEAKDAWIRIKDLFKDTSALIAYENTWAVISHLPEFSYFLYQGVKQDTSIDFLARVDSLGLLIQESWSKNLLLTHLFFTKESESIENKVPNLFDFDGFSSQIRIRFGLASRTNSEINWAEIIETVAKVKTKIALEASQLILEFSEYVDKNRIKKLSIRELSKFSDDAFTIFSVSQELINLTYPKKYKKLKNVVKEVAVLRAQYLENYKTLKKFINFMSVQDWRRAGLIGEMINITNIAKYASADLKKIKLTEYSDVSIKWQPMSELGFLKLEKLFDKKLVKNIYTLNSKEIAIKIINNEINEKSLNITEIEQLNFSWDIKLKKKIIEANQYKFILLDSEAWALVSLKTIITASLDTSIDGFKLLSNQIPRFDHPEEIIKCLIEINDIKAARLVSQVMENHLSYQNKEHWTTWIAKLIGTEIWDEARLLKLIDPVTFTQIFYVADNYPEKLKDQKFQEEIIKVFKSVKIIDQQISIELVKWFEKDLECLGYLGKYLKQGHLSEILALKEGHCSYEVLQEIYLHTGKDIKKLLWDILVKRVKDSNDLIQLLLDGAKEKFTSKWQHSWRSIAGSISDKSRALVLASRKDPTRLKKLRLDFGEENISAALIWSAKKLPKSDVFDKVLMELIAVLGTRSGPTLQWLLIQRNLKGDSGSRLEHLYVTHQIPKKSGKMRIISVPNPGLKRIQKTILVNLLNPLGAHENAFGFVKNNSIVDNAKNHVNQEVVVNADVKNCFPSVRWPIVLAAFKRDLSYKLSDRTLSALVDICTTNGGLPIGAPTSPALLNRVLYKTDIILTKQAKKRNCKYSRYADDLTFSGDNESVRLLAIAKNVLKGIGLELDNNKTNIFRRGRRQICTGLVVNDKVNIPRRIRKRIRASVHALEQGKKLHWEGAETTSSSLQGRISFMQMVNRESAKNLLIRFKASQSKKKP